MVLAIWVANTFVVKGEFSAETFPAYTQSKFLRSWNVLVIIQWGHIYGDESVNSNGFELILTF